MRDDVRSVSIQKGFTLDSSDKVCSLKYNI